jgi:hypothetical protein
MNLLLPSALILFTGGVGQAPSGSCGALACDRGGAARVCHLRALHLRPHAMLAKIMFVGMDMVCNGPMLAAGRQVLDSYSLGTFYGILCGTSRAVPSLGACSQLLPEVSQNALVFLRGLGLRHTLCGHPQAQFATACKVTHVGKRFCAVRLPG